MTKEFWTAVRYSIWKCYVLQWQLRLVPSESKDQYSVMNIARWGHLLILFMFTEKPWVPVCSHSYFSNETANWNRTLVQKSWNMCSGAPHLCICECVWDAMLHCWEQLELHYSLTGTEWDRAAAWGQDAFCSPTAPVIFIDLCSCRQWESGACSSTVYTLVYDNSVFARWRRYCKPGRRVLWRLFIYK